MNVNADRPDKITEAALRNDPITPERYTSREYFRNEWRRMWMRTWQIGGMSAQAAFSSQLPGTIYDQFLQWVSNGAPPGN